MAAHAIRRAGSPWAEERVTLHQGAGRPQEMWIIESDPDPCGGFPAGAQLTSMDVTETRCMQTFTPGTVIRYPKTGQRYRLTERRVRREDREYTIYWQEMIELEDL